MDFSIEFYETLGGACPVKQFLESLRRTDPDEFAVLMAGLVKLRDSRHHRPPLSKALGDRLFEMRHAGKLNLRIIIFLCPRTQDRGRARDPQQRAAHPAARPRRGEGTNEGLDLQAAIVKKTNFDKYLQKQLKDRDFARRFRKAGEAWEIAMQIAALRTEAGLSQNELARRLGTSQQQVSRLESPAYEGHSLSMLRRVAKELGAEVRVTLERRRRAAA